jgi:hypothetical protein
MKKQWMITTLAVLTLQMAIGQSFGEIHGTVLDENGNPMYGVVITANNGTTLSGDISDDGGRFRIKPLLHGTYTLHYVYSGMSEATMTDVTVITDEITIVQKMKLQPLEMGPVVISCYREKLIDVNETSKITIRAADLKNMGSFNGGDLKAVVKDLCSDIKVDRDGELYFRGSRAGDVLYFVDGVKLYNSTVRIPSSGVSAISVYTGGVPAKYGDTIGGVVVVETKSYLEEYYNKVNR